MKLKVSVALALALALLALGGGIAFAHHNEPPTKEALPGGLGTLYFSQESRYPDGTKGVDCGYGTSSHPECYDTYTQTQRGSSSSGGTASTPIFKDAGLGTIPGTAGITQSGVPVLGTVTFGGVMGNSGTLPTGAGRYWTGADITNLGSASVAAGGAATDSSGHPSGCVMVFAADKTQGHTIAGALYSAGVSDDSSDYETDLQLCGKILG